MLGNKLWENVVDDMNSHESWGIGGVLYLSRGKADACMKDLKNPVYGFEDEKNKFHIARVEIHYEPLENK